MKIKNFVYFTLSYLLLLTFKVEGATKAFKPPTFPDGNWSTIANWLDGDCSSLTPSLGIPQLGDDVIICANKEVIVDVDTATLASLTVEAGAKVTASAHNISLSGNLEVLPGGLLNLTGTNQVHFVGGTGGTITLNGQAFNIVVVNSTDTFDLDDAFRASRSSSGPVLTILSGTFNTKDQPVYLGIGSSQGGLRIAGGTLKAKNSTIEVKGDLEYLGGTFEAYTSSVIATGSGTIRGFTDSNSFHQLTLNTINTYTVSDSHLTTTNLTIQNGILTTASSCPPPSTPCDIIVHNNFSQAAGSLSLGNSKLVVAGNFSQSGGTITSTGGQLKLAAVAAGTYTISQSGGIITAPVVVDSSHNYVLTTNFTAASLQKKGSGTFDTAAFNLSLSSDFTQNTGTFNASSGTHNIQGKFVLYGGLFKAMSSTIQIAGIHFYNTATFEWGTSTVTFNPTTSLTMLGGTTTFYNLNIQGDVLMPGSIPHKVNNNYNQTSGTLTRGSNGILEVKNFTKSGGIIDLIDNATLVVSGTFSHTGGSIVASSGDTVRVPNALGTGIASQISLHKNNTYAPDIADDSNQIGYFFPSMSVHVKVNDPSRNLDATVADTLQVILTTDQGENETITLTETGNATGIFTAAPAGIGSAHTTPPTPGNLVIEGVEGHILSLNYLDAFDSLDHHSSNTFDTRIGYASIKRWNLAGTGNWDLAANWLPVGVPTASDTVTLDNSLIPTPYTINLTGLASCKNLSVTGNVTLNLNSHTLAVNGDFSQTNGTITGGQLSLQATAGGPYTISQTGGSLNANLMVNSSQNYSLTHNLAALNLSKMGAGTLNLNGRSLTLSGDLSHMSGTLNASNSQLTVAGNVTLSPGVNTSGSTLIWNGSGIRSLNAAQLHHFTHSGNGTLYLPNGLNLTFTGDFIKSSGALVLGPSGNTTIIVNGSFTHSGGTIVATAGDFIRGVPASLQLFKNGFTTPVANDPNQNGYGLGSTIYIQVTDANRNLDSTHPETVEVTITTSEGENEIFQLTETASNSGIFRGIITPSNDMITALDGILQLQEGHILTVTYADTFDPITPDVVSHSTRIGGVDITLNARLSPNEAKLADNYLDFRIKQKTKIGFNLQKNGRITVEIYDMKGRKIKTLHEAYYPPGDHFYDWDVASSGIRSGMYFIQVTSDAWSKPVMQQFMVVR